MARRAALLCVWMLSMPAAASGPISIAIATGDCKDADLLGGAQSFSDAVAGLQRSSAVDPAAALDKLRPRPTASLEEVQRQLDGAQSLFYGGDYDKALDGVRSAMRSLERLTPSDAVSKVLVGARVLEGLILKTQNKKAEQLEAWRRVLRLNPNHQLDPDYHTPAVIAQFEALKRELAKSRRVPLTVTSTPPGAYVFLDGVAVGKTPLKSPGFIAGDYRLTLVQGDSQSFVYDVKLADRPVELQIDLAFEAAVRPKLPLCVSSGDFDALKLAARAGADQALLLHNNEPGWVSAALFDVARGMRVREGGMKIAAARSNDGWRDLASFVLTGQPPQLALNRGAATDHAVVAPVTQASSPAPVEPQVEAIAEPAPRSSRSSLPRIVAAGLMGAGVVLGVSGLVYFATGGKDRSDLADALTADGEVRPGFDVGQVRVVDSKVQSNRNASLALGISGAAAAVLGAVLFFALAPSDDGPKVSLLATPSGAYVGLAGSF